jgi:hypothetical protein
MWPVAVAARLWPVIHVLKSKMPMPMPCNAHMGRQDFVAEAGASRKSVGSWELFVGT